jgi:hypothetical protein
MAAYSIYLYPVKGEYCELHKRKKHVCPIPKERTTANAALRIITVLFLTIFICATYFPSVTLISIYIVSVLLA